jgi:hypothetical protein
VTNLESQWAWSRVESMADRSLSADEQRRMRDAMAVDRELNRAVQDAIALRRELKGLARVPKSTALRRRLLDIANDGQRPASWIRLSATWATGFAAAAALAVAAFVLLRTAPQDAAPPEVAQTKTPDEAIEDFVIAMTYLQKSATIANAEVTAAVGGSLHEALSASRDTEREQRRQLRKNGG